MRSRLRSVPVLLATLVLLAMGCAHSSGTNARETDETPTREPVAPDIVTAEDIEQAPRAPLLQGRIAGVQVIPVAGGVQVRIRGTSTILGDSEPLYIVDGVPVQPDDNGTLPIAAHDIQTIEVLKDAVSTTMYGVRGANGVILIGTKQPSR